MPRLPGLSLCSGPVSGRIGSGPDPESPEACHLRFAGEAPSEHPGFQACRTCPPGLTAVLSAGTAPVRGHTGQRGGEADRFAEAATTPLSISKNAGAGGGQKARKPTLSMAPATLAVPELPLRLPPSVPPLEQRSFSSSDLTAGPPSRAALPRSTPGGLSPPRTVGACAQPRSLLLAQTRSHGVCAVGTT